MAWLAALCLAGPATAANFTFFVTGDTHYGQDLYYLNEPYNKATIDQMNSLPGTPYPAPLGGTVEAPQGVLVAGDLTDTPEYSNFFGIHYAPLLYRDGFNDDYAVDGTGRLRYPVYEGYGNHDVDNTSHSYTLDGIRQRNLDRPGIGHVAPGGLHYSWDWQGVHFINLNLYPGLGTRADDSLLFLRDDLAHHLTSPQQPIVLMHHFGFDSFSQDWWSDAEREAYADALRGQYILGIFHGHWHDDFHYKWKGYDVFDGSAAKDGAFLVARIANGRMDVAARRGDAWSWTYSKPVLVPEPSSLVLAALAVGCLLLGGRRSRQCRWHQRARLTGTY